MDSKTSEAATTAAVPAVATPEPRLAPSPYRRRTFMFLGIILLILMLWEGSGFFFAYTDDAVLTADLVSVAPQVTGPLRTVAVRDNQAVKAGEVLFTIDPTPFQLALDQANEAVSRAGAQAAIDQTAVASAQALQASAQAAVAQADVDLKRATALSSAGFEAVQAQKDATTGARRAADALAATQDSVLRAQQRLRLDQVDIAAAEAARGLSQWRINHTTVMAPVAGRITHFTLLPGDTATAGKPLVALVAAKSWYINANYKEGVIRHLKPGAIGWVWLDSHPFHLYRARIQGVASGIDRSKLGPGGLLPYVDPTVDWIRLEARFPVRFQLLDSPPEAELLMGSDARTLVVYQLMGGFVRFLRPIHDGLWAEFDALATDRENLREPLKAVLSVLLSVTIACLVNLPDIVWAAISGFIVMRSTVAEALPRAIYRVIGTILGAAIGFLLARFLIDDIALMIAVLFVLTWISVYQGSISAYRYAWLLFGVTAVIVVIAALSDASGTARFAAVRAAEVAIGSLSALVIAALFEAFGAPPGLAAPEGGEKSGAHLSVRNLLDEAWLARNWLVITHATQAAVGIALLPFVWRLFEITNFLQTAVTSLIVMIIPLNAIEAGGRRAIYERMAHRFLGCLIGGLLALLCLGFAGDDRLLWVLCLSAGVWIGFHIQSGKTGLSYLGTQFAVAFLVSFVQGPGPATSLDPPLTRLLGIGIGVTVMSLVVLAWPSEPRASA